MGFFSKIFKGVKRVFRKIGRGIKSVFRGIGKFVDKLGIVGQIGLMFLPLGGLLGGMMQGLGGMASTVLGKMGAVGANILKGAKFVIGKASAFAGGVRNTFRTVTQGIKTFASEFTKTALNKIGFDPTKFGWSADGSFDTWVKSGKDQTFGDAWNKVTTNITDNASKILDPFRKSVVADSGATLDTLADSTFKPVDEIKKLNPQIQNWDDISGKAINLDPDNVSQVFGAGPLQSTADTAMAAQQAQPSLLDKLELQEVPGGRTVSLDALDPRNIDPVTGNIIPKSTTSLTPTGTKPSYLDSLTDIKRQTLQDDSFRMKGVTDTTGGGSLLSMPSTEKVLGTVGSEVLRQGVSQIMTPESEYSSQGYVMDVGQPQVYGAPQQQNFIQAAADLYMGYRDPQGSYGYGTGDTDIYYNHMTRLGLT